MAPPIAAMDSWLSRAVEEPEGADHYTYSMTENRRALIVVGVIFTIIGTFTFVCRIIALATRRRVIGYDDYALFIAYGNSIGFAIASFVSVRWGVGLRVQDAPPDWAPKAVQALFAVEIFYYFAIASIKLSILFLYLRIASELRNSFYKGTVGLIVIIGIQFLTTIIVVAVQCVPMEKYWNPSKPGHCINITGFFYSTNTFTVVTDLVMLALPITTLWRINRPRPQKIGLVAAFLGGGLSTIASCVRLYSIKIYTTSHQPMQDAAPISTWSFIEINIGICCASIAVMKQLFMVERDGSVALSSIPSKLSRQESRVWTYSSPSEDT